LQEGAVMAKASNSPRQIFPESNNDEMWIVGNDSPDSNVLVTVSNKHGEKTALISGDKIVESAAKLFVQAPPERVITGNKVWYVRTTAALQVLGYLFAVVLMTFSALSVSGVVKARIVLTGSMSPSINPGDIIVTVPPTRMAPEQGDVVAYEGKRFDGSKVGVFSHRIIGGDAQNGFVVKGDANPNPDVQRPKIPDISGIVIFTLPFIGKILTPRSLIVLVPLIFGFWLVLDALKRE
jgi:signal peptidase I